MTVLYMNNLQRKIIVNKNKYRHAFFFFYLIGGVPIEYDYHVLGTILDSVLQLRFFSKVIISISLNEYLHYQYHKHTIKQSLYVYMPRFRNRFWWSFLNRWSDSRGKFMCMITLNLTCEAAGKRFLFGSNNFLNITRVKP